MARILLIDDDRNLREVVSFILQEAGHQVTTAADGRQGLDLFFADGADLVLSDLRMPEVDGMAVLRALKGDAEKPSVPVIILTAYGAVEQAVEAMRLGAYTYLVKPFNREELGLIVGQALHSRQLEQDNRLLRASMRDPARPVPMLYLSEAMAGLAEQIRQVADTNASVLISGESGTGKELVARALHDLSSRAAAPFVTVNCGAVPIDLVESTLFGHVKGAFTGADRHYPGRFRAADRGTLFLDEVGELPLQTQPKLLRVLEDGRVDPVGGTAAVAIDFRLVCASNRDLDAAVAAGDFREDLLYRLKVIELRVPPLRDRVEDIPLLWDHFTQLHLGRPLHHAPELLAALAALPWRGNVRELKNINQRVVLMRGSDTLDMEDLQRALPLEARRSGIGVAGDGLAASGDFPLLGPLPADGFSLPDLEKELIRRALAKCGGNKSRTAGYLGIPRHVLIYRLEKYGL